MKENNSQEQDQKISIADCMKIVIPAVLALAGVVITAATNWNIEKSKEAHEERMWQLENDVKQSFFNVTTIVKRAEIEYLRYELTSDSVAGGYHVIPYPYLTYEAQEKNNYIPVIGQFTQKEYVADEQGCCQMFRENVTEELLEVLAGISPFPMETGCLAAIEYVAEEQTVREIYVIRDGELTKAEQELAAEVMEAWEKTEANGESSWIDMAFWPCIDEESLQEIF